jgi:hypothetical protein
MPLPTFFHNQNHRLLTTALDYIEYITVLLTYFVFIQIFLHSVLLLITLYLQKHLPQNTRNNQYPLCVGDINQLNNKAAITTTLPYLVQDSVTIVHLPLHEP